MTERKPLSISVDMDTDKMQLKLRAIAKHAEALADELDAIDKAWQCPKCNGLLKEFKEREDLSDVAYKETTWHECVNCNFSTNDSLPMRLEGSD